MDSIYDLKSILDIISLAAGPGANLQIQASGEDTRPALERIERVFEAYYAQEYSRQAMQAEMI